jgi:hypothetical protein
MPSIRNAAGSTSLQNSFAAFRFWGDIRGECQLVAFIATVGVLMLISNRN